MTMFDNNSALAPSSGRLPALSSTPAVSASSSYGSTEAGIFMQLWRRRWTFTAVFLTTLSAALLMLKILPIQYSATGSIIVAEQEPSIGSPSVAWAQKLGDPADLESQLLLLRSPRMLRLAMAQPGVAEAAQAECQGAAPALSLAFITGAGRSCANLRAGSAELLDWITTRYGVGAVGRSRVISVTYVSQSPDVARIFSNALIIVFLADQREVTAQSREDAAKWLWQEVAQLDQSLRSDEAQIQAFRRNNDLVRGQAAPISSERLSSLSLQLSAAEAARADAAARVQELGRAGPIDPPGNPRRVRSDAADTRAALDNLAIANIKQQLASVVAQVASAAQTLGPKHPTLLALRQQEAGLRGQLRAEADSIGISARRTLAAATTQVETLNAEQERLKRVVTSATDKEAVLATMVRGAEIKRGQYETLYKRASELETERRVLTGSTRLVSLAELPTRPFFPKRGPFLAAGLTLAGILATLAAILRDRTDRRIRAAARIEALTHIPVLSEIPVIAGVIAARDPIWTLPRIRRRAMVLPGILAAAQQSASFQDALRTLHARLVLRGLGSTRQKILVTSAAPHEGKSLTCLALAQHIASSGRRVLIIDGDLRRPKIAGALGLPNRLGLVDILRGQAVMADMMIRTGIPSLDLLPAGPPSAESTELLMGSAFAELMHAITDYDLILLDSPPTESLMDARLLAPHVDGILCCARWGQTLTTEALAAIEGLREAGGEVLGIVMTAVDPRRHRLYDGRPARQAYLVHE